MEPIRRKDEQRHSPSFADIESQKTVSSLYVVSWGSSKVNPDRYCYSLHAFTHRRNMNQEPVSKSCLPYLQAFKTLKSLNLHLIHPMKAGLKLGQSIFKHLGRQLKSLHRIHDEPWFYEYRWPNVKALSVRMKPRWQRAHLWWRVESVGMTISTP